MSRRFIAAAAAVALTVPGVIATASTASADPVVTLTSEQLTKAGFPKKANVVNWSPGTVNIPTNTAAQWADVVITGTSPGFVPVGQILTMERFLPSSTSGGGTFKTLNITTTVQKGGGFSLHFQLGMPGTYGYRVGYLTDSATPEFIGFQFQFTTTGNGKVVPSAGSDKVVKMNAKQLEKAGFTRKVNTTAWGGTATISSNRVPAGAPVTIQGTAPSEVKPGTILTLSRFVPTDKFGSGSFESVPGVQTQVATDGTFQLTFEINQVGRYGYTLGTAVGEEWVGMEFQLRTT